MGEANIQINGKTLTMGQVIALRMAVSQAYSEAGVDPDQFGADDQSRMMWAAYRDRLRETLKMLMESEV